MNVIYFRLAFLLAKPQLLLDADSDFKTIHIRFGENITLKCPFENFEHFEWIKDAETFENDDDMLDVELENISFEDEGKCQIVVLDLFLAHPEMYVVVIFFRKFLVSCVEQCWR